MVVFVVEFLCWGGGGARRRGSCLGFVLVVGWLFLNLSPFSLYSVNLVPNCDKSSF